MRQFKVISTLIIAIICWMYMSLIVVSICIMLHQQGNEYNKMDQKLIDILHDPDYDTIIRHKSNR